MVWFGQEMSGGFRPFIQLSLGPRARAPYIPKGNLESKQCSRKLSNCCAVLHGQAHPIHGEPPLPRRSRFGARPETQNVEAS